MAKVSPERAKSSKHRRESRNSRNKYLRPGALAQLRYTRGAIKLCSSAGNNRLNDDLLLTTKIVKQRPVSMLAPNMGAVGPKLDYVDFVKPTNLVETPRTPITAYQDFDSRIEALPMDLLVNILCYLHHDQIKGVVLVCKRLTAAVLLAREWHFNYTTPDRSRQERFRATKALVSEHGSLLSKGDGNYICTSVPRTPKAPKHARHLSSSINVKEMRQIAASLFQESAYTQRYLMSPVLRKTLCKSLAPTRILVYEDDLCQAVVQNKLC